MKHHLKGSLNTATRNKVYWGVPEQCDFTDNNTHTR